MNSLEFRLPYFKAYVQFLNVFWNVKEMLLKIIIFLSIMSLGESLNLKSACFVKSTCLIVFLISNTSRYMHLSTSIDSYHHLSIYKFLRISKNCFFFLISLFQNILFLFHCWTIFLNFIQIFLRSFFVVCISYVLRDQICFSFPSLSFVGPDFLQLSDES